MKFSKNLIIAEVGQNHDGSLGTAHSYIDEIAKTGADGVKFQMHFADEESSLDDKFRKNFSYKIETRYEYWKRIEFSAEEWQQLYKHAKSKNLIFICSPFSIKAFNILNKMRVQFWKIASGEINNLELISKMISTNKTILLSTGMSSIDEIKKITNFFKKKRFSKFILMQCTTKYPVKFNEIGIDILDYYKANFKCEVGLSDHSGSPYPSIYAISKNASVIEVHVTFNKFLFGPDIKSSVNFEQLKQIVDFRNSKILMDNKFFDKNKISKKLTIYKNLFGRSLALNKNLVKGEKILNKYLTLKKPGTGISLNLKKKIIGKRAIKNLDCRRLLKLSDLK
jgi:N-acetylneuraminate synthase